MKKLFQSFAMILAAISAVMFAGVAYADFHMPNEYSVYSHDGPFINIFPFCVDASACIAGSAEKNSENSAACGSGEVKNAHYKASLKFMNIFPIKTVSVSAVPITSVVLAGIPFGVKIYTAGAVVISTAEVKTSSGVKEPAKESGLGAGDVIIKVNDMPISTNDELEKQIEKSGGSPIKICAARGDMPFETELIPLLCSDDDKYRAGIWVRDSSAGIGTLTFYNPQTKAFAGLGHAVCDCDTGSALPLSYGEIIEASICDVTKGFGGAPGELKGCFTGIEKIGDIYSNSPTGLYGTAIDERLNLSGDHVPVLAKQNVHKGPAKVLSTIAGAQPCYYDINIDSVNYDIHSPTKNLKISVTDPELLEKTGGIVQGMSGSPIVQDGALAGAVTHVFVNNPARGYAIFAETMLTNSNNVLESRYKKPA